MRTITFPRGILVSTVSTERAASSRNAAVMIAVSGSATIALDLDRVGAAFSGSFGQLDVVARAHELFADDLTLLLRIAMNGINGTVIGII